MPVYVIPIPDTHAPDRLTLSFLQSQGSVRAKTRRDEQRREIRRARSRRRRRAVHDIRRWVFRDAGTGGHADWDAVRARCNRAWLGAVRRAGRTDTEGSGRFWHRGRCGARRGCRRRRSARRSVSYLTASPGTPFVFETGSRTVRWAVDHRNKTTAPAPAPEKPADHQDVSPVVRAAVLVTQCALPLLGTMKADEITF